MASLAGCGQCLEFKPGVSQGKLTFAPLAEISGIAASRTQPVLWAHADSGDGPNLYALDLTGQPIAKYVLDGVAAVDWEDLAVGPGGIYVSDAGNNTLSRDSLVVYRVPEPVVPMSTAEPDITLTEFDTLPLAYPTAPDTVHDSEGLFVDPLDGAIYVVTKDSTGQDGGFTFVFTPASEPQPDVETALTQVAAIQHGTGPFQLASAADVSDDGSWIAIRTYGRIDAWERMPGATVAETLAAAPCTWPLAVELQGESFGIAPGLTGYYTASEQLIAQPQDLYFFERVFAPEGEGAGEGMAGGEGGGLSEGEGAGEGEGEGEGSGEGGVLLAHTADRDGDGAIALAELLRVVQLYNAPRFGCGASEDGYLPGGTEETCDQHDSDYAPADWVISLSELLRLVQIYATGGYTNCEAGEDAFFAIQHAAR